MDKPATYRIKVRGVVPESWIDRLGGMRIVTGPHTVTTLEGQLPDQAALKGVLDTLYELRLCLEEVTCLQYIPQALNEHFKLVEKENWGCE